MAPRVPAAADREDVAALRPEVGVDQLALARLLERVVRVEAGLRRVPVQQVVGLEGLAQARVKRRPATGESDSSRRGLLLLGGGLLEGGETLGRHRLLVLELLEQRAGLGGEVGVDVDLLRDRVLVDLGEQLVDELLGRDLPQRLAAGEDEPLVLRAGDPEVGVRRLADAVDGAAEDGDLDRVGVGLEALLDVGHDRVHVELEPAAGRAGDEHGAALAELEGLEDLPGHLDLLLRVEGGERDADGVADAVGEQRAEADGGLQRARPLRARLGDAEVQRVRDAVGQAAVRARSCSARSST